MRKLLLPEAVRAEAARRYARRHLAWWAGELGEPQDDDGPQTFSLGMPTAEEVAVDAAQVRAWVEAWQAWPGPGRVRWEQRRWPRLGTQRLPAALVIEGHEAMADAAGEGPRWRRAVERRRRLAAALPPDATMPSGARVFEALADWPDADIDRLASLLGWVGRHRDSRLLLRQLPVEGLDSKWVEQRRGVVTDFAAALPWNHAMVDRELHALLGLARAPVRLRLLVLCPQLRHRLGGLGDVEAPLDQIAALGLQPDEVLVVENLASAFALPERPGTVAFMKLGHAAGLLAEVPWLRGARVRCWGDIDSHGLAIVGRLRAALPHTESLLMDRDTLLSHRSLWGREPEPWSGPAPEHLSADERALFDDLLANTWGTRVRLEQERIPWPVVQRALAEAARSPAAQASEDCGANG